MVLPSTTRPAIGGLAYLTVCAALCAYFTFAAVQGDFGLFKRAEIDAEASILSEQYETLAAEIAVLENKTLRLSDEFLDLDLLDEQARDVLGLIRTDEIVVQ
ncbi:MAG: septum formation initiator family protein [Pseudomonadota bacterium]